MLPDSITVGTQVLSKVSMETDGTKYVDVANINRSVRVATTLNKQGIRRTLYKVQTTELVETNPGVIVPVTRSSQHVMSETAVNTAAQRIKDEELLDGLVENTDLMTRLLRGEK